MILAEITDLPTSKTQDKESAPLYVGSLINVADRQNAVDQLHKPGGLLVSTLRTCGIWFNGKDQEALENSFTVKGEVFKPEGVRSIMGFITDFIQYVDLEAIHPELRSLTADARAFQNKIGAMCFVRLPLKPEALPTIPASLRSLDDTDNRYYIHLLDPTGHDGMANLIKELNKSGIPFVGVTSLNKKGVPEIRDQAAAIDFCKTETDKVAIVLTDPTQKKDEFGGSYAIIDLKSKKVIRNGQIRVPLLEHILGTKLDATGAKEAHFEHPEEMVQLIIDDYRLTGEGTRAFILAYTNGDTTIKN